MRNKYLPFLIKSFFESDAPEEVQRKFHQWFMESESQPEKREAMRELWDDCSPGSDAQTLPALREVKKRIRRYENNRRLSPYRRFLRAASVFLLPALSASLAYYLKPADSVVREPEFVEYFVPVGERKHIILADGSEVWANAGSLLITDKDFAGPSRTLFLNGEANFSVAPNPDKPFIVKTEYMDITALGTTFNVQSYPDAGKTVTTLESGKVKISAKHADMQSVVILSPNEQLIYDRATEELITRKVSADAHTRWIQGFLVFQGNTFDELIKGVERKFKIKVLYDPGKYKGRTFTVRFSPDEDVSQVFNILKDVGGFRYKLEGDLVHIY
jgi:ferric-dicitrate binding protein FerR (iron transport regulator)